MATDRALRRGLAAGCLACVLSTPSMALAPVAEGSALRHLQQADSAQRRAFAELALDELIGAYAAELARASPGSAAAPRWEDLRRWRRSTARYLAHLKAVRTRLRSGAPVSLYAGPDGTLQLHVGGDLVLLTGPRVDDPAAAQRRVLARHCERYPCGGRAQPHLAPAPAHPTTWSFAQGRGPALLTHDGLEFPFPDLRSRHAKRDLAEAVVRDLRRLVGRLSRGAGAAPAPAALAAGPGDRVRVRRDGAPDLLVPAPALRRAPWLWPAALEWAAARAGGRPARAVLPGLERLLPDAATSMAATP